MDICLHLWSLYELKGSCIFIRKEFPLFVSFFPPFHQLLPWGPWQKQRSEVRVAWTLQGSRLAYLNSGICVAWDFPGVRGQSSLDCPRGHGDPVDQRSWASLG